MSQERGKYAEEGKQNSILGSAEIIWRMMIWKPAKKQLVARQQLLFESQVCNYCLQAGLTSPSGKKIAEAQNHETIANWHVLCGADAVGKSSKASAQPQEMSRYCKAAVMPSTNNGIDLLAGDLLMGGSCSWSLNDYGGSHAMEGKDSIIDQETTKM